MTNVPFYFFKRGLPQLVSAINKNYLHTLVVYILFLLCHLRTSLSSGFNSRKSNYEDGVTCYCCTNETWLRLLLQSKLHSHRYMFPSSKRYTYIQILKKTCFHILLRELEHAGRALPWIRMRGCIIQKKWETCAVKTNQLWWYLWPSGKW